MVYGARGVDVNYNEACDVYFFFFWFGEGLMETMRGIKNDALIISNNWQTLTRIAVFTEGFLKKLYGNLGILKKILNLIIAHNCEKVTVLNIRTKSKTLRIK